VPDLTSRLRSPGARDVCQNLVASGHAEWKDEAKTSCFIMWRSPQELASVVYEFVRKNGMVGSVYTVYELHSGEHRATLPLSLQYDKGRISSLLLVLRPWQGTKPRWGRSFRGRIRSCSGGR
jgi:hypothetical protein